MPDDEEYEEDHDEEEYQDDSIEEDLDDMLDDLSEDSEEYETESDSEPEPEPEPEMEKEQEIEPEAYYEEEYATSTEVYEPPVEEEEPKEPTITTSKEDMKFDASLEELPKVGPLYGRLVDLILILVAVFMVLFFIGAGLYTDVDKINSIEMGMLLNIGLGGLVAVVLLYVLASNNISKGDALVIRDTPEAYRAAVERYDAALKIDKRSKKAWTCKGLALRMQSHDESTLKEALKYHNMALKIDPKYSVAWVNKGNVLFNMGWSDEAIKCYDKAIDLNPDYTVAWVNKGEMLVKMGNRVEAKKCLDRARSLAD